MPGAFADRVKETSVSSGSSNFTLAGAVTGYVSFNSVFGTSNAFHYCIEAVDASGVPTGDWEVGEGYLTTSTNLVRYLIRASSNSNSVVTFASATSKNVFCAFDGLASRQAMLNFGLQYGLP